MQKASHIRKKTGEKVYVERLGNPPNAQLVVYTMRGTVVGSYNHTDMQKFVKRYTPISKMIKGR